MGTKNDLGAAPTPQSRARRAALLLCAVSVAGAFAGCEERDANAVALPELPAAPPAPALARATVERVSLDATVDAMGTVEPVRAAVLAAPVLGRVDAVRVREGAVVDAGAVVVELDATAARLRVEQARSNAAAARVQLDRATADITRFSPLVSQGVVAAHQVDQLQSQRDGLEDSLESAETTVSLASSQVRDSTIRAPFAGVVTRVFTEVGEVASPGGELVRLVDMSSVEVRARLPESAVARVHVGDEVRVRTPALGVERRGQVAFVNVELDAATRTGEALVRVDNADGALFAGAFAELEFDVAARGSALRVPTDAVVRSAGSAWVLEDAGGALRAHRVTANPAPGGGWFIEGDVREGALVATGALGELPLAELGATTTEPSGTPAEPPGTPAEPPGTPAEPPGTPAAIAEPGAPATTAGPSGTPAAAPEGE
ncbi:MAG: efflux RND transporter periplasmic adaptor subunit [Myxococcales bacterium]|nr:efflux RND transporter periplasmic adaptor subunit [Myxococcales bacterium]MCB9533837.1 efflux RND transporter periplasmic adaptor subunit [Myxococcales bacterium]